MSNVRNIFIRIAAENHTTVAEVRKEISIAIEEAMKKPDPEIQKKWRAMSKTGGVPTPEEAVVYLSRDFQRKHFAN